MNLSWDASVLRLTHEHITYFSSLSDFDKKSIDDLPSICKNSVPDIEADATNKVTDEDSVARAHISSISVVRIITAINAANHYGSISSVMNP